MCINFNYYLLCIFACIYPYCCFHFIYIHLRPKKKIFSYAFLEVNGMPILHGSTTNFLFLGPTALIYISKERRCNEDLHGIGNFHIERVIRFFFLFFFFFFPPIFLRVN